MPLSAGFADTAAGMGIGMAGGIVNGLIGQAFAEHNRQRNFYYNELAAENADKRARAQFRDMYSLPAQMRQIKAAGMSPSILYAGNGSQGGSVGAQGAGPTGIDAPYEMLDPMSLANIKLMESEARKNNAEADEKEGKNPMGEAKIEEIWANAGAQKAYTQLTTAQTKLQNINNYIADETKDFVIWKVKSNAQEAAENASKAYWEAEDKGLEFRFNLENFETKGKLLANQVAELAARTALEYSQKKLTDRERSAINDYVYHSWINAQAHAKNAKEYGDYIELQKETLPEQLRLRGEEIGLEKWRVALEPINNLIRTAGYVFGATQLGEGGNVTEKEITEYDQYGHGHAKQTTKTTKTRLPKKIKL